MDGQGWGAGDAAALVAVAGGAVVAARWVRGGWYRRPEERHPPPSTAWMVPVAALVGALLLRRFDTDPFVVVLPWLVLLLAGVALAAIDADVHRLPNVLTLPLIPVSAGLLLLASLAVDDFPAARRAALAAVVVGGPFVLLALLLPGRSIGMGDAKLIVSLALLLGWLGWGAVLTGLYLGFVLGGAAALWLVLRRRLGRRGHLAFGPYLIAGALVGALVA